MGAKLAKEVNAVYRVTLEQSPLYQRLSEATFTQIESAQFTLDVVGALHTAMLFLADAFPDV